jgi:Heparinase II/III-like protein
MTKLKIGLIISLISIQGLLAQEAPVIVVTPENPYSKAQKIIVKPENVLNTLQQEHPRLLLTKNRINELKKQALTDTLLSSYIASVIKQADDLLKKPDTKKHRETLNRELVFGMAYHFTGDKKYYAPVLKDLLNICEKPDWEWIHFLDPSESSMAVGIGYDWFYDCIPDSTKKYLRTRLINNGLIPGLAAYAGAPYGWFTYVRHNWNQVCNSGLMIGALAIAETDTEYAKQIVSYALASQPLALNEYAPDGAYPEGTGYWGFGTSFSVYGFEALKTALGTDFGLSNTKGFNQTFYFSLYTRGTTGLQMTYADVSPKTPRYPNGLMLWAANLYNDQYLADNEHAYLKQSKRVPSPYHVLFYKAPSGKPIDQMPLDRYFNGPVPVVTMRGSWTDKKAAFIGMKSGYNQVNHGHLDLGNFEIDLQGERWLYDIGSDHYELKGYFVMDSTRWNYYRNNSKSHNVPMIDGESQNIRAIAKITKTSLNTTNPFAITDLTDAYKKFCKKAERGIALVDNRKAIVVQDEFTFNGKHNFVWGVSTDASITIKGNEASLTQNGKTIKAKILAPANAVFTTEDAPTLSDGEKPTKGIHRLFISLNNVSDKQTITVLFANENGASITSNPLSIWK